MAEFGHARFDILAVLVGFGCASIAHSDNGDCNRPFTGFLAMFFCAHARILLVIFVANG
jgi:hypothetical protein